MQGASPLASPEAGTRCGTGSPCPGERTHLKRRRRLRRIAPISPGPPSPSLPALPIERRFYRFCTEPQAPMRRGRIHVLARSVSAAGGLMPGCRGRRPPRRNKLWDSPFPAGRGCGGMGAENNAKGRVGGRGERQAPPAGAGMAGAAGDLPPLPPPPETAPAESAGGKEGKPPFLCGKQKRGATPAKAETADTESGSALLKISPPHSPTRRKRAVRSLPGAPEPEKLSRKRNQRQGRGGTGMPISSSRPLPAALPSNCQLLSPRRTGHI